MANEIQRPKKVQVNVNGRDFRYTKSRRKRPTQKVWIDHCLRGRNPMEVEFLRTNRGTKCFVRSNDPGKVMRSTEPWDPQPVDPETGAAVVEDAPTYAGAADLQAVIDDNEISDAEE